MQLSGMTENFRSNLPVGSLIREPKKAASCSTRSVSCNPRRGPDLGQLQNGFWLRRPYKRTQLGPREG